MLIPIGYDPVSGQDDQNYYAYIEGDKHQLVVGKSGAGKSTLLERQALEQIDRGHGVCFIDPHGDSVKALASAVPKRRTGDVIWFDPTNHSVIPLNPLENKNPDLEIDALREAIKTIWPNGWGAETERILTKFLYATYALSKKPTLQITRRLLTDPRFRQDEARRLKDPSLQEFFQMFDDDKEGWNVRMRMEKSAPPSNKLDNLLDPVLLPIIGDEGSFDFRRAMDERKIILCYLPKGKLGERSALLGSLIVRKISNALLSRENVPQKRRKDFYVYIDEFPVFMACTDVSVLLAESRKYGGRFALALQTCAILDPDVGHLVFGNCTTIISFRVGAKDADILSAEFAGEHPPSALINLNPREFLFKTVRGGVTQPTLKRATLPPINSWDLERNLEIVKRTSRANFAKPRK